jgi:multiple sugar transport system substrate-binding protein
MDTLIKSKALLGMAVIAMVAGIMLLIGTSIALPNRGKNLAKAELTMWGIWDEFQFMDRFAQDFRNLYPNVTIKYRKIAVDNYEKELTNALAEDRGPDIFAVHHTWLAKHKTKMQPIPEDVFTLQEYQDRFLDVVSQDFVDPISQQIYGVPLYVDTMALFYNKDAYNDAGIVLPPVTWSDFQETVKKLTKFDNFGNIVQSGIAMGTADNVNRASDIFTLLMIQNGAKMNSSGFDRSTFANSVSINGKDVQAGANALEFYTDFANPRKEVYTWNSKQHYSIDAFYERETAMIFGYSYQIANIRAKAPRLNFGVAPVPQIDPTTNVRNFANYWGYSVSSRCEFPKEAYAFLKYMTEDKRAQQYFLLTKRPTSVKALVDVQKDDPDYGIFAKQSVQTKTWYRPDNNAIDEIFLQAIRNINTGVFDYNRAMDQAQKDVNLLFLDKRR